LHPHLNPHLCLYHPLNHLFHCGRSRPLRDSMGPKMINFLEFSLKLPRKIKGKNLFFKVLDLLLS
jgi:hypothetical protein